MAEVGIEVRNSLDQTIIQIDSTYRNLAFIGKVSVTCSVASGSMVYGEFTTNQLLPFAGHKSAYQTFVNARKVSGGWTYRVYTYGSVARTVEFFLFDYTRASSTENYGIEIYNGAAELVFSSSAKYCKVVGMINGSNPRGSGWNGSTSQDLIWKSFGFPLNANIIVVQNIIQIESDIGDGGSPNTYSVFTYAMCARVSPNIVTLSQNLLQYIVGITSPSKPADILNYSYLVVDVSNI